MDLSQTFAAIRPECDPVYVHGQGLLQVFAVLGRQRRDGEDDRGGVDALAVRQLASDIHAAFNFLRGRHLLIRHM